MSAPDETIALAARCTMATYERLPLVAERGEGAYIWDVGGKRYLDFTSGISVCNVGHRHPDVVAAIKGQLGKLIHSSNLIYNRPAAELAARLSEVSLGGKVFLCNSGAEANEGAIKLARKRAFMERGERSAQGSIVVCEGAFHGRTLGALSATPQVEKQRPFEPLVPGFAVAKRNDVESLRSLCDDATIAIMLEPVQGESGVNILSQEFIAEARLLADRHRATLIFDEVQCGLGRTGTLWAYQQTDVVPDLVTVAKSLAGGLPAGAVIARPELSGTLELGDHGSTFGGGALVAAAALAVLDAIDEEMLAQVDELGQMLGAGLTEIVEAGKAIEARGRGLIWALDLAGSTSAREVVRCALGEGILLSATSESTLRFLPPFVIGSEEVQSVLDFLKNNPIMD